MWEELGWFCRLTGAGVLILLTVSDIKTRKIPILLPILMGIASILLRGPDLAVQTAAGMLPGLVLLIAGRISGGQIGEGDAVVLLMFGAMLGGTGSMQVFLVSMFLVFLFACAGLLLKKLNRKTVVPYMPFYCIAYLGVLYL